jgi:hypothetical protein
VALGILTGLVAMTLLVQPLAGQATRQLDQPSPAAESWPRHSRPG